MDTRFQPIRTVSSLVLMLLTACSAVTPEPFSEADFLAQGQTDLLQAGTAVPPLGAVLTLEEAISRALKYNLEVRTRMMEEALEQGQLDVSNYDMLPRLLAQAGYSGRNNERISQSRDAVTGDLSPSRFISQERSHTLSQVGISWSLLDLGMGYYGAQQQADRLLIASEKRRKIMHQVMQDVHIAFWRAASAQVMRDRVLAAIELAESALMDARQAEAEQVNNPVESLRYQRQLLENLRLLEAIGQELSSAQVELATLINAPLNQNITVVEPSMAVDARLLDLPLDTMEELAMGQNPDIREQHYNARIARVEARKVMAQLFPNISFDYNVNYDTDRYLVNNEWNQAGLQLSFNLFNLLTAPTQLSLAKSGIALADQRRVAMQMAVLTQVHLARLQYANSLSQFTRADEIWDADRRLLELLSNRQQAQLQSTLDVVTSETATLLSQLRRYQAWAETQASAARLQFTLGEEPYIGSVTELTLEQLVEQLLAPRASGIGG